MIESKNFKIIAAMLVTISIRIPSVTGADTEGTITLWIWISEVSINTPGSILSIS